MLEHIAIKQVELSTILADIENSFTNVASLFAKLCDVIEFIKEIKEKLNKIDKDIKTSAQRLQLDPSSSSTHHIKVRYLEDIGKTFERRGKDKIYTNRYTKYDLSNHGHNAETHCTF